jgi:uncharacterized protein YjbI with pentapeptide repeats
MINYNAGVRLQFLVPSCNHTKITTEYVQQTNKIKQHICITSVNIQNENNSDTGYTAALVSGSQFNCVALYIVTYQ